MQLVRQGRPSTVFVNKHVGSKNHPSQLGDWRAASYPGQQGEACQAHSPHSVPLVIRKKYDPKCPQESEPYLGYSLYMEARKIAQVTIGVSLTFWIVFLLLREN